MPADKNKTFCKVGRESVPGDRQQDENSRKRLRKLSMKNRFRLNNSRIDLPGRLLNIVHVGPGFQNMDISIRRPVFTTYRKQNLNVYRSEPDRSANAVSPEAVVLAKVDRIAGSDTERLDATLEKNPREMSLTIPAEGENLINDVIGKVIGGLPSLSIREELCGELFNDGKSCELHSVSAPFQTKRNERSSE